MARRPLKLQTKITLFIIMIVIVSIYSTMYFTMQWIVSNMMDEIHMNIMNMAQVVATNPLVIEGIRSGNYYDNPIQPYVEQIIENTERIEIVVVADMNSIRYAHNLRERLGMRFVGGDERRVVETGETYISTATGTLGNSLRAFAPVIDPGTGQQLGFVMVGTLTQTIARIRRQRVSMVLWVSVVGLCLGIVGAVLLAGNIKKSLLGLEPDEIARLYVEKQVILDAVHEGLIAVDDQERITVMNESASNLFKVDDQNYVGVKITDLFPFSRMPEVLKTGVAEYDREQLVNDTLIIVNRVPIKNDGKVIGVIASFRDKTMITRLAEEVTGVKQIVEALRANNHEFMNKLHVILGLIEIGHLKEAQNYIADINREQQQVMTLMMKQIKDPTIVGLLLGKSSRAKELGISLTVDEASYLERTGVKINSNVLVTVIGNLLENAMDAVLLKNKQEKWVWVRLEEDSEKILIQVKDNGIGIRDEDLSNIFERGFSTKSQGRGIGLALVKETVENLGGTIWVSSRWGEGADFTASIPKEGKR